MILVLLGTHELQFTRLLFELEKLVRKKIIHEEIVVQKGNTKYTSNLYRGFDFIDPEELSKLYHKAGLIITHAGVGSIVKGLQLNKKIIACPRLKKHNEHNDDHQLEIAKEFARKNYILMWDDNSSFEEVYNYSKQFKPSKYISNKDKIIEDIKRFIDNN